MTVFRNLLIAKGTATRPYYCEVEYLDAPNNSVNALNSQDAAYIDTGIVPDDTTIMEARIQFNILNTNNREQLNGSTAVDARFAFGFGSVQPYTNFYAGLTTQNLATSVPRDLNPHTFILDALNKTITIDGTTEAFTTAGSMGETEQSIYLFARNSASYQYANKPMNGKVYYCKITKNGSLVRDMIPVLDLDMTPCMYDKVSGMLFYSVGTGDFTAGRQIHGIEYLETSGNQYIDGGRKATNLSKIEADVMLSSTSSSTNRIFGNYANNNNAFTLNCANNTNTCRFGNQSKTSVSELMLPLNERHIVGNSQAGLTKDGVLVGTAWTTASDFTTTGDVALLASTNSTTTVPSNLTNGLYGKCYGIKWWENDVLMMDLIPAVDENGVGFMFDRVNHTIHDNAGTGDFVVGPIKEER